MSLPGLQLSSISEVSLCIFRELCFLLFCVTEITPIFRLLRAKVDGNPGRIAHEVDKLSNLRLHCSHALNSGGAITNDCNTFVRPVVGVIPKYVSLLMILGNFVDDVYSPGRSVK